MKLLGMFLLIFGVITIVYSTGSYFARLTKWNDLQTIRGGKRYASNARDTDWITRLGQRCNPLISTNRQEKLKQLLVWSGIDSQGRVNQFLGLCLLFILLAILILLMTGIVAMSFHLPVLFAVGILLSLILLIAPVISVLGSRFKRADSILKEMPLLTLCVRRELVRDANYIEAFECAETELSGVLKDEVRLLNAYVRSTKGDIRSALEQFRNRCGHKAIELFCMTIIQGMDTDRVVDGLKELDLQMSGILKDRVQKQTEKRNLMVFFGTMVAASILLLQGAFYGLMKLKEQLSGLPF